MAARDKGVAAACLLTLFGKDDSDEDEKRYLRAFAGALQIVELREELRNIRKALTAKG